MKLQNNFNPKFLTYFFSNFINLYKFEISQYSPLYNIYTKKGFCNSIVSIPNKFNPNVVYIRFAIFQDQID